MKVKDLIKELEKYDGESLIEVYNTSYTDSRFDLYFGIDELCFEERDINNVAIIKIKHTGEMVK